MRGGRLLGNAAILLYLIWLILGDNMLWLDFTPFDHGVAGVPLATGWRIFDKGGVVRRDA